MNLLDLAIHPATYEFRNVPPKMNKFCYYSAEHTTFHQFHTYMVSEEVEFELDKCPEDIFRMYLLFIHWATVDDPYGKKEWNEKHGKSYL